MFRIDARRRVASDAERRLEIDGMKNKITPSLHVHKRVISRVFLVIALLLTLIEAAWAGPYSLAMSKDKALCESMLSLYNKDMKTYGRINYDAHEIFSRIKWENIDKDNPFPMLNSWLRADFDINNDGKDETVVKFSGRVQAANLDTLYIYPGGSDIFSKNTDTGKRGRLLETPNMLFEGYHSLHYLKHVPKLLQEKILTYKLKHLPKYLKKVNVNDLRRDIGKPYIAGSFVLQPFIWHGTTYISITNRHPEWIVVGKYKQAKEVQDICYFYDQSHRSVQY